MAGTATYSGTLKIEAALKAVLGGDWNGTQKNPTLADLITFAAAGGAAPTLAGWMYGTITFVDGVAVDALLAHATDPLQGCGDAGYSLGFTVAGSKLKYLYVKNTHATLSLTVARKATLGLPIFDAASDAVTLAPGDIFVLYKKAGTAALTTGSNDGLTLTPSATGGLTATILAAYGP